MKHIQNSFANYQSLLLIAGTIIIGFLTFTQIDHSGMRDNLGKNLIKGVAQTNYEKTFESELSIRDASISFWSAIKYGVFNQTSKGAVAGKEGWFFTAEEYIIEPEFDQNITKSIDMIVAAHKKLSAEGIQLIPAIIPDKSRIMDQYLTAERPALIEARYDRLIDALRSHNIPAVDLRPTVIAATRTQPTFMRTDTHWSPYGANIVAKDLSKFINYDGLDTSTYKTEEEKTAVFEGDLLKYAPTGAFRSLVGPEPEQHTQYITEKVEMEPTGLTGGLTGLFGDADIPLALIGTSFSDKIEWNFEGFLKQHTGLDLINLSEEGKGPFVPMHNFLSSDFLKDTPPMVVIWEIPERYTALKEFVK